VILVNGVNRNKLISFDIWQHNNCTRIARAKETFNRKRMILRNSLSREVEEDLTCPWSLTIPYSDIA